MYSAVCLFCEDIREEKSGMDSLIGVLPDNVSVPALPFAFPKIGIYLRIHLPASGDGPKSITYWLTSPDPLNFPEGTIDPSVVEQARGEAKKRGAAIGGLITKAMIVLLNVRTAGRITMHVKIDGQEFIAGALNIQKADA